MAGRPPDQSDEGQPPSIDDLAKELRSVVRSGVDRAKAHSGLSALGSVQRRADAYPDSDDGLTLAWRAVVREVLESLDDSDPSHAARLLFGGCAGHAGTPVG